MSDSTNNGYVLQISKDVFFMEFFFLATGQQVGVWMLGSWCSHSLEEWSPHSVGSIGRFSWGP